MFLITMINGQGLAVCKLLSPHTRSESELALTSNGWAPQDDDQTGHIWRKPGYDGLIKLQEVQPMAIDEVISKVAELEKR